MDSLFTSAVTSIQHTVNATVGHSPVPLLIVAAYAGCAVVLYGLTKGKEFLIAGYSSMLFLIPFIHLS